MAVGTHGYPPVISHPRNDQTIAGAMEVQARRWVDPAHHESLVVSPVLVACQISIIQVL